MNINKDTTVIFADEINDGTVIVADCDGEKLCKIVGGLPHGGFHLLTVKRRHPSRYGVSVICNDENGGEQGWRSSGSSPVRVLRAEVVRQANLFAALLDEQD